MRIVRARRHPATLLHTGSLVVLGALVSGCAGEVARFSDGFYTSAVPVRPPAAVQTPFPENAPVMGGTETPAAASAPQAVPRGVDTMATGSVGTAVPGAVSRAPVAAPSVASQPLPPAPPSDIAGEIQRGDATGPVTTARTAPAADSRTAGWTGTGGTYVTLSPGETLFNLSKRYGVPVGALQRVNNLADASSVQAGQRILIPTYVYGASVPVSAPDANAAVRSARASVGGRSDVNLSRAPAPTTRPDRAGASEAPAVAAASTAASAAQGGRYTVQAGDSLSLIASRTGASVDAIKRTNGLSSDVVRIGQTLIIPGLSGAASATAAANPAVDPIVTSSVTPETASTEPAASSSVRTIDQASTARAPDATGVASMRWPAQGRIVSAFGSNSGGKPNDGIDISVPVGTAVKAAENGVVIYAGNGLKEFGNTVLVRHSDGYVTVYGHLDAIEVDRGETISRGQTLGTSGMTGNARQPQLHFEVRKDTKPVDPVRYLN